MDPNKVTAIALRDKWNFFQDGNSNFYVQTFNEVTITVNPIEETIRLKDIYGNIHFVTPYPTLQKFTDLIERLNGPRFSLSLLHDYQVMDIMQRKGLDIKLCAGDDTVLVGTESVSFMIDDKETIKHLDSGKWQAVLVMFNKEEFYNIKNDNQ